MMNDLSNQKIEDLDAKILYLSGGPGCGKGTQCEKLVNNFKYEHFSVGDLMRAEVQKGSELGLKLKEYQSKGELVPTETTLDIIWGALRNGNYKYLIDGFPRNLDQALVLENNYRDIDYILNFNCSKETLLER